VLKASSKSDSISLGHDDWLFANGKFADAPQGDIHICSVMRDTITVRDVLALQHLKTLSNDQIRDLLSHQEGPFSLDVLIRQFGRGVGERRELERAQDVADRQLERYEQLGVSSILIDDPRYPHLLREIPNPPLLLYSRGNILPLNTMMPVAIIGSRKATPHGLSIARRLGKLFSTDSFAVVSGLAIGCDIAAHRGALDTANGYTVAVLANSLDSIYPKENSKWADEIVERGGCLISEQPIDTTLRRTHFILRNRIQSGISHAVILVQSERTGGSMHTMKFAREQGRVLAAYDHGSTGAEYGGNQLVLEGMGGFPLNSPASIDELKQRVSGASWQHRPVGNYSLPQEQLVLEF
jgi:DNA processing protein